MANKFDTMDLDVFFNTDDFAVTITAGTWGTSFSGIYEENLAEFEDITRTLPYFTTKETNVPSTATTGDLFKIDGTEYKLVDVRRAGPGITRVDLALTS